MNNTVSVFYEYLLFDVQNYSKRMKGANILPKVVRFSRFYSYL